MPHNSVSLNSLKNWWLDTLALSTIQSISWRRLHIRRKYKKLRLSLKSKRKNLPNNGNNKESRLISKKYKIQLIELRPRLSGKINLKEWMSKNHFGFAKKTKFQNNNTKNSIKLCSKTLYLLWLGVTSKLKGKLNSQGCCMFLNELNTINLKNSLRKSLKLNFSCEEC